MAGRMSDRLHALVQRGLPKRWLTELAGRAARGQGGAMTQRLIGWFVKSYRVDMSEAVDPDIASYASFNDFFVRPLREGARPIADAAFVSPVDGAISQLGPIEAGHIVQAKGHRFTVRELVGGDAALAERFHHGSFANLYLSPRDYHRVHMPCAGRLTRMIYVPGALFSVNPVTARTIPNLFARNERIVCVFDTPEGDSFVMVLVGATIVGSMATVWHGAVNPQRTGKTAEWDYTDQTITLAKGEEMGRFLLGSTVVTLFPAGAIAFNPQWRSEGTVRLGEPMGERGPGPAPNE